MQNLDLNDLFAKIESRLVELGDKSERRRAQLLAHIRALGDWENDAMDYPVVGDVEFPQKLQIAYAVCHPNCGKEEFIVDGSSQECQRCGQLMFRTKVREYQLK